jgi:hypothetical protein
MLLTPVSHGRLQCSVWCGLTDVSQARKRTRKVYGKIKGGEFVVLWWRGQYCHLYYAVAFEWVSAEFRFQEP